MTEPQLQPLAYAAQDANVVRYARPLVIWGQAVAILSLSAVAYEMVNSGGNSSYLELFQLIRRAMSFGRGWAEDVAMQLRTVLPGLAALLVGIGVTITYRTGWVVSSTSLLLIRAAAVLMLLCGVISVGMTIKSMFEVPTFSVPISQVVTYTAADATMSFIPGVLLLAASFARFHSDVQRGQRVIIGVAIVVGIPVALVLFEQAVRWILGTPPYWTKRLELGFASINDAQVRIYQFQYTGAPILMFVAWGTALLAGLVMKRTSARRRPWLLALAVLWMLPVLLQVLTSVLLVAANPKQMGINAQNYVINGMDLLLAVLAWCLARDEQPVA